MIEILLALTPADYSHLARAVQVEAVPNTMDEYCVAASILNRVASPYYPSTVEMLSMHLVSMKGYIIRILLLMRLWSLVLKIRKR